MLAEESAAIPVNDRLQLQIAYGQALMECKGYGAPETTAAFARAHELVGAIEDSGERFAIFYGLWVGSFIRGQLAPMPEIAAAFLADVKTCAGLAEATSAVRIVGLTRACSYLKASGAGKTSIHRASADLELTDAPLRPSRRPMGSNPRLVA